MSLFQIQRLSLVKSPENTEQAPRSASKAQLPPTLQLRLSEFAVGRRLSPGRGETLFSKVFSFSRTSEACLQHPSIHLNCISVWEGCMRRLSGSEIMSVVWHWEASELRVNISSLNFLGSQLPMATPPHVVQMSAPNQLLNLNHNF